MKRSSLRGPTIVIKKGQFVPKKRTARIYHDSLPDLLWFKQFGKMSGTRAKVKDGIKLALDILTRQI
jgi:hypothetical protein